MNDLRDAESERSWADLKKLTDEDLIRYHDLLSFTCKLGPEYYREEIRSRQQLKLTQQMRNLTCVVTVLTAFVTVATIISLFAG